MPDALQYESVANAPSVRRIYGKLGAGLALGLVLILWLYTAIPGPSGRSRETAYRVRCMMRLSELDRAFRTYAQMNDGWLPPDIATLAEWSEGFSFEWLVCPSSGGVPARSVAELRQSAAGYLLASQRDHCSYIYVGDGLRYADLSADDTILYEPLENHDHDVILVLFAQGVVDSVSYNKYRPTAPSPAAALIASAQRGDRPVRVVDRAATLPTR